GIRDRNVTGVQTCALPISHLFFPPSRPSLLRLWYVPTLGRTKRWVRRRPADTVLKSRSSWLAVCLPSTEVPLPTSACAEENVERSEERRVGKDRRYGRSRT